MNIHTAIFVINPSARALSVLYDDGQTPKLVKTLDPSIQKDDIVIVPTGTRFGFTGVKVVETDVLFNIETQGEMKWVVGKVAKDQYEALVDAEKEAIKRIQSAEMLSSRKALAEKLKADTGVSFDDIPLLGSSAPTPKA